MRGSRPTEGRPRTAGVPSARRTVVVGNPLGLHARAAARFVRTASAYDAEVRVARNGAEVSGVSILGLMMLAAGPGAEIEISAEGADAEAAVETLSRLVSGGSDDG